MSQEIAWVGRKSKHSPKPGSGGYTAQAYDADLRVGQCGEGGEWHYTVTVSHSGKAETRRQAQSDAAAVAYAISDFLRKSQIIACGECGGAGEDSCPTCGGSRPILVKFEPEGG